MSEERPPEPGHDESAGVGATEDSGATGGTGATEEAEGFDQTRPEAEWVRRRRLAEVFGDVLPEQTSDDAESDRSTPDSWLRDQVPPHHG